MSESDWRDLRFIYRVPEGRDWDPIETQMIEACAALLGCNHHEVDDNCPADWTSSSGPLKDYDEDGNARISPPLCVEGVDRAGRRWTRDPDTDCRYIALRDIPPRGVACTVEAGAGVNLDYDEDGNLLGVELI